MSLHKGEVIRYGGSLYRVDYVNECRCRIVPLAKRHVVLADGREFDAERGGVNISPDSPLEIVADVERARLEMELEATERELAEARAEAAREAQAAAPRPAPGKAAPAAGKAAPAAGKAAPAAGTPRASKAGGWHLVAIPEVKPDSLKASVVAFLKAHPGAVSVTVAGATPGAVAACLDRFYKSGVITRK